MTVSSESVGAVEAEVREALRDAERVMGRVHGEVVGRDSAALEGLIAAETAMGAAHQMAADRVGGLEREVGDLRGKAGESAEEIGDLKSDLEAIKDASRERNDILLVLVDWWRREGQYGDCPWCRESGQRPHYSGCPIGDLLLLDRGELVEVMAA